MSWNPKSLKGEYVKHNFDNGTFRVIEELHGDKIRVVKESKLWASGERLCRNEERIFNIGEII